MTFYPVSNDTFQNKTLQKLLIFRGENLENRAEEYLFLNIRSRIKIIRFQRDIHFKIIIENIPFSNIYFICYV